jgi:hypothetical protein
MTTYAPTFTGRFRATYQAAGIVHTAQLRKVRGASDASIQNLRGTLGSIFAVWADHLPTDFEWLTAEWARQDEEFFTPNDLPDPVTGAKTPALYTPIQKITATTFSGRAPGSKARVSMFGIFWMFSDTSDDENTFAYDGKVTAGEDARVQDTIDLLNTQTAANSGDGAIWYPRATIKPNDHLLRLVRRGLIS